MTSERDVLITGVGPATAIGVGADEFWSSLQAGRSRVTMRTLPFDVGQAASLPIAAIDHGGLKAGLDKHEQFLAGQDAPGLRDLTYALLAVELALADAGLQYDRERNRIGVVQVFEAPAVERTVSRLFEMIATPPPPNTPPQVYDALSPHFYSMQPFLYVHLMSKAFGFHGFSTSVHNACTSGAFAMEIAARQIRSGNCDAMIVAGGEAFETAVRLEWFRRLDLYAREPIMRPFDTESSGFFVGEGAGAVVLESRRHATARQARPYAEYRSGAFAQQSWKQVIPDVRGGRLRDVIRAAIDAADVKPSDIDLIVPHGTATQLSDGYEAASLSEALRGVHEHAVAAAFKPYVGHLLAANVVIETIATLLAMRHQCVPATLHTSPDRCRLPVPLATENLNRPLKYALKISTGFTGHDAAMLFSAE